TIQKHKHIYSFLLNYLIQIICHLFGSSDRALLIFSTLFSFTSFTVADLYNYCVYLPLGLGFFGPELEGLVLALPTGVPRPSFTTVYSLSTHSGSESSSSLRSSLCGHFQFPSSLVVENALLCNNFARFFARFFGPPLRFL
ncbi:hypothetical protein B0H11DRAFT_1861592, partial [Mycena galericulata]